MRVQLARRSHRAWSKRSHPRLSPLWSLVRQRYRGPISLATVPSSVHQHRGTAGSTQWDGSGRVQPSRTHRSQQPAGSVKSYGQGARMRLSTPRRRSVHQRTRRQRLVEPTRGCHFGPHAQPPDRGSGDQSSLAKARARVAGTFRSHPSPLVGPPRRSPPLSFCDVTNGRFLRRWMVGGATWASALMPRSRCQRVLFVVSSRRGDSGCARSRRGGR